MRSGWHLADCCQDRNQAVVIEPSVPLATALLILAEEKGLQVDPPRADTAA